MSSCKPRFKGIENFLRRIAFNLGNTPSQTEVKIISCIPIDVTDLQHKILELEKELEETNRRVEEEGIPVAAPQTRQPGPAPSPSPPGSPQKRKSIVSTALGVPTRCPGRVAHTPTCSLGGSSHSSSVCEHHPPHKSTVAFARTAHVSPSTECAYALHDAPEPPPQPTYSKTCNHKRGLFAKVKKKRKAKGKTQFVYYAQPDFSSPFSNYNARQTNTQLKTRHKSPESPADLSSSFLKEVVRKQFKPGRIVPNESGSIFTEPVCRDELTHTHARGDCSCCNINFHDVDDPTTSEALFAEYVDVDRGRQTAPIFNGYLDVDNQQRLADDTIAYIDNEVDGGYFDAQPNTDANRGAYYDSSLYDVIPVRETSYKQPINESPKDIERTERLQPYVAIYNASRASPQTKRKKTLPVKSIPYKRETTRRLLRRKSDRKITGAVTRAGSIDFGDVYMKPILLKTRGQKAPELPTQIVVQKKNAGCLTINVNHTECQTASSKSVQLEPPPPEENRTEETLNQIKSILQSVLTEVKVNAQQRTEAVAGRQPVAVKRDAIVQKEASQGDVAACSSLLNSLTYSPYNSYLGPYARPVVSRPPPQEIPAYANQQKCLQNYPLFIHTTGRQCACCFRSVPSRADERHAATTATNTENAPNAKRSKETEKLIKEIYKSIAVNMDYPARETSTSEGDDTRSMRSLKKQTMTTRSNIPPAEPRRREESSTSQSSQVMRANAEVNTSSRMYSGSKFGSEMISNAVSMRSALTSRTTTGSQLTARARPPPPRRRAETAIERSPSEEKPQQYATNATSASDTETESSDDDSDATVVVDAQPKKKSGLFSKITRLFKPKSKKDKKEAESDEAEGESDSDDYQTVYSQRSRQPATPPPRPKERMRYRRTHSKISNTRYAAPRPEKRRTPYLEQEYRRHWNERLAFHEGDSPRYTSAEPFERDSYSRGRPRPVYYQDYVSRPALVQQRPNEKDGNTVTHQYGNRRIVQNAENQHDIETQIKKGEENTAPCKGIKWLHKGTKQAACCGRQWKDFILEG